MCTPMSCEHPIAKCQRIFGAQGCILMGYDATGSELYGLICKPRTRGIGAWLHGERPKTDLARLRAKYDRDYAIA